MEDTSKHLIKTHYQSDLQRLAEAMSTEAPVEKETYLRRFPSGAVRSDNRGRIRPDYISPYALVAISEHFTKNEKEFGKVQNSTNYFLGIPVPAIFESLKRHLIDLHIDIIEEASPDKLREEFAAIASNAIMALHTLALQEKGLYKEVYEETEYVKASDHDKQSI